MKRFHFLLMLSIGMALLLPVGVSTAAERFTYDPPGSLVPGSGQGRVDHNVYFPEMRFPVESAPTYANSQVYGVGGLYGPPGGQCDSRNYSYPWRDNYCEYRSWTMPLCPSGQGHQGQDIRGATCEDRKWWTVAAENGTITSIGSYSVYLQGDSGIRHRYLHLEMSELAVSRGQRVQKGQRIGKISQDYGGTPTSYHLHFDMYSMGLYIPPYMSLVNSYRNLLGNKSTINRAMMVILDD